MSKFNSQSVANTAWAFATVKHQDEMLFAALVRAVERRLSEFKPQELANTAWAFATAIHRDEMLFAALAKAADRQIGDCNAQEIATYTPIKASTNAGQTIIAQSLCKIN